MRGILLANLHMKQKCARRLEAHSIKHALHSLPFEGPDAVVKVIPCMNTTGQHAACPQISIPCATVPVQIPWHDAAHILFFIRSSCVKKDADPSWNN